MKKETILLAIVMVFMVIACKNNPERNMLVKVNPDGSIYREISTYGDSVFMTGGKSTSETFGVVIDSTWEVLWRYKTPEFHKEWPLKKWQPDTAYHGSVMIKAVKTFPSVRELNEQFRYSKIDHVQLGNPVFSLEKKFRWFYTYYTYSETNPQSKPEKKIPISVYMNQAESDFWFQGKLDLIQGMTGEEIKKETEELEQKQGKWLYHNLLGSQYDFLIQKYDSIPGLKPDKKIFILQKDSVILPVIDTLNEKSDIDLARILDKHFKTDGLFSKYFIQKKELFKNQEDTLFNSFVTLSFLKSNYSLVMPGKIIQMNNLILKGDTLFSKLSGERIMVKDYTISATSRKTNVWAFVVTILVLLLATGSYFIRKR